MAKVATTGRCCSDCGTAGRAPEWPDLAPVFQIEREIGREGKMTQEVVYGITRIPLQGPDAGGGLEVVHGHWHLENRRHWRRDVTLGEDGYQVK